MEDIAAVRKWFHYCEGCFIVPVQSITLSWKQSDFACEWNRGTTLVLLNIRITFYCKLNAVS